MPLTRASDSRLRVVDVGGYIEVRIARVACDMAPKKDQGPPPPSPPLPSQPPPPVPPAPLVTEQHVLRATQTVFGSAVDVGGLAPSWSDASWLSVVDFDHLSSADGERTAWAQVGPWGALSLTSRFELDTNTWNALRFTARTSHGSFQVRWDRVGDDAGDGGDTTDTSPSVPPSGTGTTSGESQTNTSTAERVATEVSSTDALNTRRRHHTLRRRLRQASGTPEDTAQGFTDKGVTEEGVTSRDTSWSFPTQTSGELFAWRENFVPLDFGFFGSGNSSLTNKSTSESTADVSSSEALGTSWDRLSWRDTSGTGGEIQLRDVRLESWVYAEDASGVSLAEADQEAFLNAPATPPMPSAPNSVQTQAAGRGDSDAAGVNATSLTMSPPPPVTVVADDGSTARFLVTAFFAAVVFLILLVLVLVYVERCLRRKRQRAYARKLSGDMAVMDGSTVPADPTQRGRLDQASLAPARIPATDSRHQSSRDPQYSRAHRRRPPLPRRSATSAVDTRWGTRSGLAGGDDTLLIDSGINSIPRNDSDSGSLAVSRNTSTAAGDSNSGGDFGGVLRGDSQEDVVPLTLDALALALETTVERETTDGKSSDSASHESDSPSLSSLDSYTRETKSGSIELAVSEFDAEVTLESVLGQGASAVVHKATWAGTVGRRGTSVNSLRQQPDPIPVAVKFFRTDTDTLAEFWNELSILKSLGSQSRRVVSLLATVASPSKHALVMQLVNGGSLHAAIHGGSSSGGGHEKVLSSFQEKVRMSHQLARALEYLHCRRVGGSRGHLVSVAHLDLKPKNVLLEISGRENTGGMGKRCRAVLADFGSAVLFSIRGETDAGVGKQSGKNGQSEIEAADDGKAHTPTTSTTEHQMIGTVNYAAPELFEGYCEENGDVMNEKDTAERKKNFYLPCDVFSWSVLCWEVFVGKIPWRGSTPTQIVQRCGDGNERLEWGGFGGQRGKLNATTEELFQKEVKTLIETCWSADASDRPSFTEIVSKLRSMRSDMRHAGKPSDTMQTKRTDTHVRASSMELSSASE